VAVADGRLSIVREGQVAKFVPCVEQLSFSAAHSRQVGQEVLYVTERAVFRLIDAGLELIEVAPGIDVGAEILGRMPFAPLVRCVRPMPAEAFAPVGQGDSAKKP